MTVTAGSDGSIELKGSCPAEDAEVLLQHLLGSPAAPVHWHACEWVHTAVIQVLLVARSVPLGTPTNIFLQNHIGALLRRAAS